MRTVRCGGTVRVLSAAAAVVVQRAGAQQNVSDSVGGYLAGWQDGETWAR